MIKVLNSKAFNGKCKSGYGNSSRMANTSLANNNPYYHNFSNPSYDTGGLLASMGINGFNNLFTVDNFSKNYNFPPLLNNMLPSKVMHDWQTRNGFNPNYDSVAYNDGFNIYKDNDGKLHKDPNLDKTLDEVKVNTLKDGNASGVAEAGNNTQKGLLETIWSAFGMSPESAEAFGNFGKGIGGLASIGTGIYNAYMQNKAFNLQKDAMKQAMQFNAENQARQRHEWARQDQNRASISSSWNGR